MMFTTFIFDMDGTLYDTEQIYRRAWLSAGVPEDLYETFIGTSHEFINQALKDNGFDPDQVRAQKTAFTDRELEKGVPLKPGVLEALKWLRDQGCKCAIATSSHESVAQRYLDATQMHSYFDRVVSGYALEHGKPEPDIFLLAAGQLGSAPEECVVVEDSFNGVRAGHAAGMYTVMVPDMIRPDEEIRALADAVLPSLEDLPNHFESLQREDRK